MIGVIGCGFVGSAVASAFDDVVIVDPLKSKVTIDELVWMEPECVFVCVPTPQGEDGSVDGSIVANVLNRLEGVFTILKSTITPDHIPERRGLVYNPEFLTQANSKHDFLNPAFHLFGGSEEDCARAHDIYRSSGVADCPWFYTDIKTASLVKYTINSFLALKVAFLNEIFELHSLTDSGWQEFTNILSADPRMGISHFQVPGPDGQRGFGGACFPKDTEALARFAENNMIDLKILKAAIASNKEIRERD